MDNLRFAGSDPESDAVADEGPKPDGKHGALSPKAGSVRSLLESDAATRSTHDSRVEVPEFPMGPLREYILPTIARSINIGSVERDTRFGFFKRVLLRGLRIISLKQTDFNRETANALALWADHASKLTEATRDLADSLRGLSASTGDALARQSEQANCALRDQARLVEELRRDMEGRMRRMLRLLEAAPTDSRAAATDGSTKSAAPAGPLPSVSKRLADARYLLYEDAWRGDTESVLKAQAFYVDLLKPELEKLPAEKRRAADLGCGRGELVQALREAGVDAVGVDSNTAMTGQAGEAGAPVFEADAAEWLSIQPENSLGLVTAIQVLEHLEPSAIQRLIGQIHARLAPGGIALFETINPACFSAHRWFHMDPTHVFFLAPETLRFFCECAGFEHVETRLIHPVEDWKRLEAAGDEAQLRNIEKLNDALFGCQDYFVLVRKSALESGPAAG
jgi:O-antigen chain-terminating methyltransferase